MHTPEVLATLRARPELIKRNSAQMLNGFAQIWLHG
jgi:hypothetical protein